MGRVYPDLWLPGVLRESFVQCVRAKMIIRKIMSSCSEQRNQFHDSSRQCLQCKRRKKENGCWLKRERRGGAADGMGASLAAVLPGAGVNGLAVARPVPPEVLRAAHSTKGLSTDLRSQIFHRTLPTFMLFSFLNAVFERKMHFFFQKCIFYTERYFLYRSHFGSSPEERVQWRKTQFRSSARYVAVALLAVAA